MAILFNGNIDLTNSQMLRTLLENLTSHPSDAFEGKIYWNTSAKKAYVYSGTAWIDITNIYNHPVHAAMNPVLSGANVLASLEVNSLGHVISASTRLLTLADLGYTGDPNANNYTHPTFTGNDLGTPLTGSLVISDVDVNAQGHVTGFQTRNITPADIGAAVINDSLTNLVNTWSSSKIQQELNNINSTIAGALVYIGGYNASTNVPNLDNSPPPNSVKKGNTFTVTTAGLFFTEEVQAGDMIIAEIDNPSSLSDYTVVNKNIPDIVDATNTVKGIIRLATQAEVNAGTLNNVAVSPATLVAFYNAQQTASGFKVNIGNGSSLSHDILHNLNTKDVAVELFFNASGSTLYAETQRVTLNTVRVLTNVAFGSNEVRALIRKV